MNLFRSFEARLGIILNVFIFSTVLGQAFSLTRSIQVHANETTVKRFTFFLSIFPLFSYPMAWAAPAELLPTLPSAYREARFAEIKKGFEHRWHQFEKGQKFSVWSPNRSDSDLEAEYERMDQRRRSAWFEDPNATTLIARPDFMVAQDILAQGAFRNLNTIGFEYNKTDSSYNSSSIILDGLHFLALEAPTPALVPNFYRLLLNQRVTHLVRLTPAYEGTKQVSAPYWDGKVTSKDGLELLSIPQSTQGTGFPYPVKYFAMDDWLDNAPGNPEKLLKLVNQVRAQSTDSNSLVAVHCYSGVSRTGTFLAAFLLLNEIDQQLKTAKTTKDLKISIEETVSKLSLFRPHAVGKPKQYVTLYRLIDLYIGSKLKSLR